VESPGKGLSDMDVARAATGQGWPFAACPWSGGGMREPRRSRGRMVGCPSLWWACSLTTDAKKRYLHRHLGGCHVPIYSPQLHR